MTDGSLILSATLHSILPGINLAVASVGFFLYVRYLGYLNFAYAAFIAVAVYSYGAMGARWFVIPVACAVAGALAAVNEAYIVRSVRRSGSQSLTLLLISLGVFIILVSTIQMIWGPDVQVLPDLMIGEIVIGRERIPQTQFAAFLVNGVLLAVVLAIIKGTPFGCAVRALGDDEGLAVVTGINVKRLRIILAAAAAVLAGWSGLVTGMDVGYSPLMGVETLFLGAVVVALSGRSLVAVIGISLLLYCAVNVSAVTIQTHWSKTVVFVLLLAIVVGRARFRASSGK